MKTSDNGLDLIAEFEGFVDHLYNDPANHCTIGIGHLVHLGRCGGGGSEEQWRNGISYSEAVHLLQEDVKRYEDAVNTLITVPLNQNQFDALVSFTFNVGAGALADSTLRRLLNVGNYQAVPEQLRRWNKGGGQVLPGLVRRREAEVDLWLRPVEEGEEMSSREYEELKKDVRDLRAGQVWFGKLIKGAYDAIDFLSTVVTELTRRTK